MEDQISKTPATTKDAKPIRPAPKPSAKKPSPARPAPATLPAVKAETPASEPTPPSTQKASPPSPSSPTPSPAKSEQQVKPITLTTLLNELQNLKLAVADHTRQIADLQERLSRKRTPTSNGKVQIRDKQTGKVYPSKNNAYQSLLKAGELKVLVDKGVFGDVPEKNTFGWYALKREWPDRFEEVVGEAEVSRVKEVSQKENGETANEPK